MGIENRKVRVAGKSSSTGPAGGFFFCGFAAAKTKRPNYGSRAAKDGGPGRTLLRVALGIGDGGVDIVGSSRTRIGNDLTEGNPLEEAPIAPGMMNAGDLRADRLRVRVPSLEPGRRPVNRPRAAAASYHPRDHLAHGISWSRAGSLPRYAARSENPAVLRYRFVSGRTRTLSRSALPPRYPRSGRR